MNDIEHIITGGTAVKIAESLESAIRAGTLSSGATLPTVRGLAKILEVSPATVSSAYHTLNRRGMIASSGRRGTKVTYRPVSIQPTAAFDPSGARNLYDGNPDPDLLPSMEAALQRVDPQPRLYGAAPCDKHLVGLVRDDLTAVGINAEHLTFVNGAMDGLDRILADNVCAGDAVGVEDPGWVSVVDLVVSRGLRPVPIAVDQDGPVPSSLRRALGEKIKALVISPRAQNPTGAVISEQRQRELNRLLVESGDVLLFEDDHANLITTAPLRSLHAGLDRWAHMRSLSKTLNPDLRLAAVTGDGQTIPRLQERIVVGDRWVSHILQQIAYQLLKSRRVRSQLTKAARIYDERREALCDALRDVGYQPRGESGFNVWLPVEQETAVVHALLQAGWAVAPGERFRSESPPGVRITAATLTPAESQQLAQDLATATCGAACRTQA